MYYRDPARAEDRVMLTREQDGKIGFIASNSNVSRSFHLRTLVLRDVQRNSLF